MIKIIKKIIAVLDQNGEENYKNAFQRVLQRYEATKNVSLLKKDVINFYGGMGSFNDLILYNDGKVCVNENNTLDRLRRKLIQKATK